MLVGTVGYLANVIRDLSAGKRPPSLLNRPLKPRGHFDFAIRQEVLS
jgi:hypothetical protein